MMGEETETAGREAKDAIRAFICVEVPETIKERIAALQHELRRIDAQVSWVKPSKIHLTLKFLGDVPASKVGAIELAIKRAAGSMQGFEIEVGGAGCFPTPRRPRVFWVGLTSLSESLKELHASIESELEREGFAREAKRFSPHLTIGRARAPKGADRLAEDLIARGFEPERFRAREIILMRSDLNAKGSIYTPLATIPLIG